MIADIFIFSGGRSVSAWNLLGSGLTPCCDIILPIRVMVIHLKRHFSLLSFRFSYLHVQGTFFCISSLSLPCSSKPAIKMSSVIPMTFGMPLNYSSIFVWNIPPTEAAPNCSLCIDTCQMDMKKLLDMMIYHLVFNYVSLSLHLLA